MADGAAPRLYVVLEEASVVKGLRSEIDVLQGKIRTLGEELRRASFHRSCEQSINAEVIDLLRTHGIKYRPGLDISKWPEDMRK